MAIPIPDQSQWRGIQSFLGRLGTGLLSVLQVTLFVSVGLLFVLAAALLISIIQFQIRVIEAKTQSRNFSLTSLTQSVEMQKQVVRSIRTIQAHDRIFLEHEDSRNHITNVVFESAPFLCRRDDGAPNTECTFGLVSTLMSGTSPALLQTFERHLGRPNEQLNDLHKKIIAEIIALTERRAEFAKTHKTALLQIRSACFIVMTYIRLPPTLTAAERSLFINDFAIGYLSAAEQRCLSYFGPGTAPTAVAADTTPPPATTAAKKGSGKSQGGVTLAARDNQQTEEPPAASPSPAATPNPAESPNTVLAAARSAAPKALQDDLAGALLFDLIAYYRFYETLFTGIHRSLCGPSSFLCARPSRITNADGTVTSSDREFGAVLVEQIVIAPIDISFVLLVIICGALGAMLRITALTYKPTLFGPVVDSEQKRMPLYYFIIGIMCSLIVYIRAKTVFAGLADTAYVAKSGNMSPFVIAFLAVVSGLLCEEAFQRIVAAGKAALARSTGNDGSKAGDDGPKKPG